MEVHPSFLIQAYQRELGSYVGDKVMLEAQVRQMQAVIDQQAKTIQQMAEDHVAVQRQLADADPADQAAADEPTPDAPDEPTPDAPDEPTPDEPSPTQLSGRYADGGLIRPVAYVEQRDTVPAFLS